MSNEELAYLGIGKLKMRFENKINPEEYYLSYSAGMDSHLIYWFVKNILKNNTIKIVSVNTYREHNEIRERMYKYADVVLYPTMEMYEIKECYGMPCFTKNQDEIIRRYQNGSRSPHTLSRVHGTGTSKFKLNNTAKELLLSGRLHKVSPECCYYTNKAPLKLYEKKSGLKPIVGVRGEESESRKNAYRTCLSNSGKFTPLYDFTDEMITAIYDICNIEIPGVYNTVDRTVCIACPYGMHGGNTLTELNMVTRAQRQYAIESFKESYEVLGLRFDINNSVIGFKGRKISPPKITELPGQISLMPCECAV